MIEAERALYVIESLTLIHDEGVLTTVEDFQALVNKIYRLSHAGNHAMHSCQHPDWEAEILETERGLVASGTCSGYEVEKSRGPGWWKTTDVARELLGSADTEVSG